jgi:hypothetical protein
LKKLKSLNIQFNIENFKSYVPILLETVVNCKEKCETVAEILVKLPDPTKISIDDYGDVVITLLFHLKDDDGAGKIHLFEKLEQRNFTSRKNVVNYLISFSGISGRLDAKSVLHFIVGNKLHLMSDNLPKILQRRIIEVCESLDDHVRGGNITQESRKVITKITTMLMEKIDKTKLKSKAVDESFKQMIQNIHEDKKIDSNVVVNDYKREAISYLDNAVMDSKSAVKFVSALKQLKVIKHDEFIEEIITQSDIKSSKLIDGVYSDEIVIATTRFQAELIFQQWVPVRGGEFGIILFESHKHQSEVTEGCRNLLRLTIEATKFFQLFKAKFEQFKT